MTIYKENVRLRSIAQLGLALTAAVVFGASPAMAQAAEDFSVGLGGGFSRVSGSIGYHALATLEFPSPVRAVKLRADGLFADWGAGQVTALTGNLLFTPISGKRVAPYLLAGSGGYSTRGKVRPGWTLGAGLRLPGELRAIVLESRLHSFRSDSRDYFSPTQLQNRWHYMFTPIGFAIQF